MRFLRKILNISKALNIIFWYFKEIQLKIFKVLSQYKISISMWNLGCIALQAKHRNFSL